MTWAPADYADLHPDLQAELPSVLVDAVRANLHVIRASGSRTNAVQQRLYETYLAKKADYDAGRTTVLPLPAAAPGASAHNYARCSREPSHVIGARVSCPVCGSATLPASLAVDVALLDGHGVAIHCPAVPLAQRPAEWRTWAGVIDGHPRLRDGGDFQHQLDPVHIEMLGWNFSTRTYLA